MAAAVGEGKGCAVAGSPEARGGRGGSGGLPAEQEREGNPAAAPVLPGFDDVDAFVKVRGGAGAGRGGGEAGGALCTTAPADPRAVRAVALPEPCAAGHAGSCSPAPGGLLRGRAGSPAVRCR